MILRARRPRADSIRIVPPDRLSAQRRAISSDLSVSPAFTTLNNGGITLVSLQFSPHDATILEGGTQSPTNADTSESEALDHGAGLLALLHALNRHAANFLGRLGAKGTSIEFHTRTVDLIYQLNVFYTTD